MNEIGDDHAGEVSEETRMMAARVRERASHLPTAGELADMTIGAGRDMSPEEIRQLATAAIEQASQVAYLLGRLAGLLDEPGERRG